MEAVAKRAHLDSLVHYDSGITQDKTWVKSAQILSTQTTNEVTQMLALISP